MKCMCTNKAQPVISRNSNGKLSTKVSKKLRRNISTKKPSIKEMSWYVFFSLEISKQKSPSWKSCRHNKVNSLLSAALVFGIYYESVCTILFKKGSEIYSFSFHP